MSGEPSGIDTARAELPGAGPWSRPHASIWLLLLLAAVVRVAQIDATAHIDEMYHLLSALSWLEEGAFEIGDGHYTRARAYTILVAASIELFGESLVAARLPSLLAGLAWIGFVFLWTQQVVGLKAAWIAGLLFAFDPGAVNLSQVTRFYTLQGTLVWLGATGLFWVVTWDADWRRRGALGGAACLFLALGVYFQPATAIGLTAIAVWLGGELLLGPASIWRSNHRFAEVRFLLPASIALGLLGGALAFRLGWIDALWTRYSTAASWAQPWVDQWRFYHWWLEERYPVLWRLFPLASIYILYRHRRVAAFVLTLFVVPLLLHSFAAQKHERYLYFAVPFFFVSWGIAVAGLLPGLTEAARRTWQRVAPMAPGSGLLRWVSILTLAMGFGFFAYTSPALKMTIEMVREDGYSRPYGHPDWGRAQPTLRELAEGKDVILASRAIKAMYFVGRADAEILAVPPQESTTRSVGPYRMDTRTGRPIIGREATLRQFLGCYETGLVIVETPFWRSQMAVTDRFVELLERWSREVAVPEAWGLVVREWTVQTGTRPKVSAEECEDLRRLTSLTSTSPEL